MANSDAASAPLANFADLDRIQTSSGAPDEPSSSSQEGQIQLKPHLPNEAKDDLDRLTAYFLVSSGNAPSASSLQGFLQAQSAASPT